MKKYILSLIALTFISMPVFADERQEAINFFNNYVESANSYSSTVAEMYSPTAKIIRQIINCNFFIIK